MPIQLEVFINNVINGLTLGALYGLVTLGLALIFGVARMVNFAHGDFFMVSGYVLYLLITLSFVKLPYPLVVVLVVVLGGLFAALIERTFIHRILESSWRVHAVATLGISIILQSLALIIFKSDPYQTPTPYSSAIISPLGIRITEQRLIVIVAVVLVFLALQWFVKRTRMGKTMRAVSQNRLMCIAVGIDVNKVAMMSFAISGALAGLAAALIAPIFSVTPAMGSLLTLKGLAAVIMGGIGHVNGAFYAAFLMGIVEAMFGGYVSFAFKDVVSFGMFIVVLLLRPHGLFGKRIGL